jgi:hypothetical protein
MRLKQTRGENMAKLSKSDQLYIMGNALLEISIQENMESIDELMIISSTKNKGTHYIVEKKSYYDKSKKTNVWFKKVFK